MEILTKEDVLSRRELIFEGGQTFSNVRVQGEWGKNFFQDGDNHYIPVIYKGEKYKKRIRFKPIYE